MLSHTVVLPLAVPPATPIKNGWLLWYRPLRVAVDGWSSSQLVGRATEGTLTMSLDVGEDESTSCLATLSAMMSLGVDFGVVSLVLLSSSRQNGVGMGSEALPGLGAISDVVVDLACWGCLVGLLAVSGWECLLRVVGSCWAAGVGHDDAD